MLIFSQIFLCRLKINYNIHFTGQIVNGSCNEGGDSRPPCAKLAKTEFVLNSVNGGAPITLVHHQEPLRTIVASTNDPNNNNGGETNNIQNIASNPHTSNSTNVSLSSTSLLTSVVSNKPDPETQDGHTSVEESNGNFIS